MIVDNAFHMCLTVVCDNHSIILFDYKGESVLDQILKYWKRLNIITFDAMDLLGNILQYENKLINLK